MTTDRLAVLSKFLEEDPNDPFNHYAIALEYASMNDMAGAMERLREIVRRFPSYTPAYQQLGGLLASAGARAEARAILQLGILGAAGDMHAQGEMQELLDELNEP